MTSSLLEHCRQQRHATVPSTQQRVIRVPAAPRRKSQVPFLLEFFVAQRRVQRDFDLDLARHDASRQRADDAEGVGRTIGAKVAD
ncbi:MAG: hypothetical protein K2Y37_19805 [Pirellulales bacterium]|nr:hypothetical protein [Pirellulales bacterium]